MATKDIFTPGNYFKKENRYGKTLTFFRVAEGVGFEGWNRTEKKWIKNNEYAGALIGKIDFEWSTEEEFNQWAKEVGDIK